MKVMGMYLQDLLTPDLHADWEFRDDADFLEGTGASRLYVRDETLGGELLSVGANWVKSDLSFEFFQKTNRLNTPQFNQVNVFATAARALDFLEEELGHTIS